MKAIKLSVLAAAVALSGVASANVVTEAASGVAHGAEKAVKATGKTVANTGKALWNGAGEFVKTATHPAAVSAEVGTLGAGANIAWSAGENADVVIGWAGGDIGKVVGDDISAKGVNYELDTRLSNPYIGVRVRPMQNGFTVGTGIIIPDNKLEVKTNPNDSRNDGKYHIGGTDYTVQQLGTLEGKLEHRNRVAPYLTVGYHPSINKKWGVFGEVGAAYLGETQATIKSVGGDGSLGTAKQEEVVKQAERDLEDKSFLKWAPIAKVGATYRF